MSTTIFDNLRADHDRQRALIDQLVDTVGDNGDRQAIFDELRVELEAHAAAEERHFYVPLMQHDLTQDKARHSVAEHKELDDFVEQLDDYDRSGPKWLPTAEELQHRLLHHLEEEEREVFPLAGKVLGEDHKTALAEVYEQEMSERRNRA